MRLGFKHVKQPMSTHQTFLALFLAWEAIDAQIWATIESFVELCLIFCQTSSSTYQMMLGSCRMCIVPEEWWGISVNKSEKTIGCRLLRRSYKRIEKLVIFRIKQDVGMVEASHGHSDWRLYLFITESKNGNWMLRACALKWKDYIIISIAALGLFSCCCWVRCKHALNIKHRLFCAGTRHSSVSFTIPIEGRSFVLRNPLSDDVTFIFVDLDLRTQYVLNNSVNKSRELCIHGPISK